MQLSLFDLHCDTACRMLNEHQPLSENSFCVSLKQAKDFHRYYQIMALWTSHHLDDEHGWNEALRMLSNLKNDPSILANQAQLCSACPATEDIKVPVLMLSVEDARILNGKTDRVNELYRLGVRIITPLWSGVSCIGGAHDTGVGLTDFGKAALCRALSLGMIPDISHASRRSAQEIFTLAQSYGIPVIASHSNAFGVCPVSRNLSDRQIGEIVKNGGIIGLNLHRYFLREDGEATLTDVLLHIDYFLNHGAEKSLCIGADMDGGDMPKEIPSLFHLSLLAEELQKQNFTDELIRSIFFDNAYRFARRYIKL